MLPALTSLQKTEVPVPRPRTIAEWRSGGVDYALDLAIDIGGVLIAVFVAWLFIRFVARRIERWGDDGRDHLHSARGQRARTAAKLVRNFGRAVLSGVAGLMGLN